MSQVGYMGQPVGAMSAATLAKNYDDATRRARGELDYPAPRAREVGSLQGGPIREKFLLYAPIDDVAQVKGALLLIAAEHEELFYRPTVLADVDADAPAYAQEIFGPVAPVATFADDDEAIRLANGTEYGLKAALHSGSYDRAIEVGSRLEAGAVHINDVTVNPEGNPSTLFQPVQSYTIGTGGGAANAADAVTAADFDGDGDIDVAVTSRSQQVRVMLNNGNGTFATGVMYAIGDFSLGITSADLDSDGDIDLVTAAAAVLRPLHTPIDRNRAAAPARLRWLDHARKPLLRSRRPAPLSQCRVDHARRHRHRNADRRAARLSRAVTQAAAGRLPPPASR